MYLINLLFYILYVKNLCRYSSLLIVLLYYTVVCNNLIYYFCILYLNMEILNFASQKRFSKVGGPFSILWDCNTRLYSNSLFDILVYFPKSTAGLAPTQGERMTSSPKTDAFNERLHKHKMRPRLKSSATVTSR